MNFCFIFAMIFMMGSLDLIHAEPYSKSNLEKSFLNKPRGLKDKNCFEIIYGDGGTFSLNGGGIPPFIQDSRQKTDGLYNGTTTLLCLEEPSDIEDLSGLLIFQILNHL